MKLFHDDAATSIEHKGMFQHVITDAPYDLDEFPIALFAQICTGNIITFCKPENQFFKPTKYGFWVKPVSPKNVSKQLSEHVEMILIWQRGAYNVLPYPNNTNVWFDILEDEPLYEHQKPLSLMERLIRIYSNVGDVILDPYCGTGTTLLAARNCGRDAIGIEKDKGRYNIAEQRLGL